MRQIKIIRAPKIVRNCKIDFIFNFDLDSNKLFKICLCQRRRRLKIDDDSLTIIKKFINRCSSFDFDVVASLD